MLRTAPVRTPTGTPARHTRNGNLPSSSWKNGAAAEDHRRQADAVPRGDQSAQSGNIIHLDGDRALAGLVFLRVSKIPYLQDFNLRTIGLQRLLKHLHGYFQSNITICVSVIREKASVQSDNRVYQYSGYVSFLPQ
jgi:hypothetical protein